MQWQYEGVTAKVAQRRRYGATIYTWLYLIDDATGEEIPTRHHPWPAVRPKAVEVQELIQRVRAGGEK